MSAPLDSSNVAQLWRRSWGERSGRSWAAINRLTRRVTALGSFGCLIAGLVCLLSVKYMDKADKPYLLIIRCEKNDALDEAEQVLKHERLPYALSSCIDTGSYVEAIYEMGVTDQGRATVSLLKTLPGILTVSMVDCRKDG